MANLPESSAFDAGVYQLETTDPVIGGPSGVSNTPLKNLANRTKYLKDHVDALESTRAPLASPAFTGTPTSPTAAAGTNTTQLATTAFVQQEVGGKAGTASPQMNGTASVGTAAKFSREDHVHPTDSTRAPLASPAFTGTPTAHTPAASANNTQLATTEFVKTAVAGVDLSGFAPKASPAFTGAPTAPTPTQGNSSGQLATTAFVNAEIANDAAPISHVGSTGAAHGVATQSVAGFMSAADKAALDDLVAGFGNSKATAGYQRLPSGLIVQWGLSPTITAISTYVTFTFPIAFPTACLLITGGSEGGQVSSASSIAAFSILSKTSARMDGWGNAATFRGAYIAIGY